MTDHQTIDVTYATYQGRIVQVSDGSDRFDATTVTNIPLGAAATIALRLSQVVFWPVPREIDYEHLMSLRPGQIVRG